jgi:hypothetical protein
MHCISTIFKFAFESPRSEFDQGIRIDSYRGDESSIVDFPPNSFISMKSRRSSLDAFKDVLCVSASPDQSYLIIRHRNGTVDESASLARFTMAEVEIYKIRD